MRRNPWFETVAEARRRARRRLPGPVFGALVAGSERGRTLADNVQAFAELGFAPRVAGHQSERELSTTVLGIPVSMPVLISPTGVQAVHPDGEVAVARAAANRGVAMGLSSFASRPVEEVVAAQPDTLFQLYWSGGREVMLQRMERARAAGVRALILTLDWSFSHGRDWGSPAIPERIDLRTMLRFAPDVLPHPSWLLRYAKAGKLPDLTTPNQQPPGGEAPTFFGAYGEWMRTPPPTWDDVAWLIREWGGPLLLKGVTRVDDARRAVDAGVAAISVSNHGGNNLDTTPATIRVLPSVAAAVGDQIEVLLDGGIRRGGDVAKALALGARAVMIGRAYLWGLAANGQAGVENVLDILRGGLDSALLGLGHCSVHELSPDDLVVPDGFARVLGGAADTAISTDSYADSDSTDSVIDSTDSRVATTGASTSTSTGDQRAAETTIGDLHAAATSTGDRHAASTSTSTMTTDRHAAATAGNGSAGALATGNQAADNGSMTAAAAADRTAADTDTTSVPGDEAVAR